MKANRLSRREKLREQGAFPAGMFAALLTAASVTLIGVSLRLEPLVILVRSSISAVLLGCLVSLGVSIVRLADSEYKKREPGSR
jgi:hypothetical protein